MFRTKINCAHLSSIIMINTFNATLAINCIFFVGSTIYGIPKNDFCSEVTISALNQMIVHTKDSIVGFTFYSFDHAIIQSTETTAFRRNYTVDLANVYIEGVNIYSGQGIQGLQFQLFNYSSNKSILTELMGQSNGCFSYINASLFNVKYLKINKFQICVDKNNLTFLPFMIFSYDFSLCPFDLNSLHSNRNQTSTVRSTSSILRSTTISSSSSSVAFSSESTTSSPTSTSTKLTSSTIATSRLNATTKTEKLNTGSTTVSQASETTSLLTSTTSTTVDVTVQPNSTELRTSEDLAFISESKTTSSTTILLATSRTSSLNATTTTETLNTGSTTVSQASEITTSQTTSHLTSHSTDVTRKASSTNEYSSSMRTFLYASTTFRMSTIINETTSIALLSPESVSPSASGKRFSLLNFFVYLSLRESISIPHSSLILF